MGLSSETFCISQTCRAHFNDNALRVEKAYKMWLESVKKAGQEMALETLLKKDFSNVSFPKFEIEDSISSNQSIKPIFFLLSSIISCPKGEPCA